MPALPSDRYYRHLEQIQQDLDLALQTIALLAEHLRPVLEQQGSHPQLRQLLDVQSPTRQTEWIAHVDRTLANKPSLGELRELTGLVWDQVHGFADNWKTMTLTEKHRLARHVLMRQAMQSA